MHRPEGSLNIILTRLVSKNIKSDNVTDTLVTLIMGGGTLLPSCGTKRPRQKLEGYQQNRLVESSRELKTAELSRSDPHHPHEATKSTRKFAVSRMILRIGILVSSSDRTRSDNAL